MGTMTSAVDPEVLATNDDPVGTAPRTSRLRVTPGNGIVAATAAMVLGFALIAFTWWKVSEFTNSAAQIPYVVSGGLTGLGLVVVGAALLVVVTRGGDDRLRAQQAEALVQALQELADSNRRKAS